MSDATLKIRSDFLVLYLQNPYEAVQIQPNGVPRISSLINVATAGSLAKAETHCPSSEYYQSFTKLAYFPREHLQMGYSGFIQRYSESNQTLSRLKLFYRYFTSLSSLYFSVAFREFQGFKTSISLFCIRYSWNHTVSRTPASSQN